MLLSYRPRGTAVDLLGGRSGRVRRQCRAGRMLLMLLLLRLSDRPHGTAVDLLGGRSGRVRRQWRAGRMWSDRSPDWPRTTPWDRTPPPARSANAPPPRGARTSRRSLHSLRCRRRCSRCRFRRPGPRARRRWRLSRGCRPRSVVRPDSTKGPWRPRPRRRGRGGCATRGPIPAPARWRTRRTAALVARLCRRERKIPTPQPNSTTSRKEEPTTPRRFLRPRPQRGVDRRSSHLYIRRDVGFVAAADPPGNDRRGGNAIAVVGGRTRWRRFGRRRTGSSGRQQCCA